jgi:plastocyanin
MVAAGAALAAGCGGDGGDEGPEAARPAASATLSAPASSNGRGGGAGDVRIVNFAFTPATVRAKAGQRVTWEHQDPGVTHTVTAVKGAFRSGELDEGDEFSHVFPAAGTFAYRCAIHPGMRGRVTVGG